MVDNEDVEQAIETLEKFKRQEHDHDHKHGIENIRQMLVGVYNLDGALVTEEEVDNLEEVLQFTDPEVQAWSDAAEVETLIERGRDWIEHRREYPDNYFAENPDE